MRFHFRYFAYLDKSLSSSYGNISETLTGWMILVFLTNTRRIYGHNPNKGEKMKILLVCLLVTSSFSVFAKQKITCAYEDDQENIVLSISFKDDLSKGYIVDKSLDLKGKLTVIKIKGNVLTLGKKSDFFVQSFLKVPTSIIGNQEDSFIAKHSFLTPDSHGSSDLVCKSELI